jgi:flagellar biosynthesis/type III secretory pathway M-ring protein FliF/YscJ
MFKSNSKIVRGFFILILVLGVWCILLLSQENQVSYLSQKLLLENSLRERITEALNKLLDDINFVVDVAIDLEFTSLPQTAAPAPIATETQVTQQATQPKAEAGQPQPTKQKGKSDLYLPLPGFEAPADLVTEEEKPGTSLPEGPPQAATETVTKAPVKAVTPPPQSPQSAVSIPVVKRQQINIILEDGISPEIIENVRQVVAIASHYDRARGDVISIMTASFKKRQDQDAAEAIILKNIAEKVSDLEEHQREAERTAKIEQQKQQERQAVVRDSLRIQELRNQISDLKDQLGSSQLSEDQRAETKLLTSQRETELTNLKDQLRESNRRLQELEMNGLETTPPGIRSIRELVLYIVIGLLGLAILVVLILLLINRRTAQKRQEMEWGYGTKVPMQPAAPPVTPVAPRPVEKVAVPQAAVPVPPAPAVPAPPKPEQPAVENEALREEMKGIKQSVISMSVGQPDTASRIINDWLEQERSTQETESEAEGGV